MYVYLFHLFKVNKCLYFLVLLVFDHCIFTPFNKYLPNGLNSQRPTLSANSIQNTYIKNMKHFFFISLRLKNYSLPVPARAQC